MAEIKNTLLLCANEDGAIEKVGKILREGGVAAIPTETVYGLAANALDGNSVRKIYEAKGRPADNPLIVHVASFDEIAPLVTEIPESAKRLAEVFWPGPLTMIFPKSDRIPDAVSAGLQTVAIRFPQHPVAQAVIRASGVPLAAPSANLSGKPSPTSARHVIEDMMGRIDAILDGGECSVGVESTVVTFCGDVPRVLRPGKVTPEEIAAVLGHVEVHHAATEQIAKGEVAASPGMKYKHYAPKARVILLDGDETSFRNYVNKYAAPGVGVLCYENEEGLAVPGIVCGRESDFESQARRLFDALRETDEQGFETVYAHCPKPEGVGLAVYNRLIRAAGFEVRKLG